MDKIDLVGIINRDAVLIPDRVVREEDIVNTHTTRMGRVAVIDNHHIELHQMGLTIAAAMSLKGTAADYEYAILIDEIFKSMPRYVQEFILAHELGHIALGHLDGLIENGVSGEQLTMLRLAGNKAAVTLEHQADTVAVAALDKTQVIMAMRWKLENIDFGISERTEVEINERIQYIRDLYLQRR